MVSIQDQYVQLLHKNDNVLSLALENEDDFSMPKEPDTEPLTPHESVQEKHVAVFEHTTQNQPDNVSLPNNSVSSPPPKVNTTSYENNESISIHDIKTTLQDLLPKKNPKISEEEANTHAKKELVHFLQSEYDNQEAHTGMPMHELRYILRKSNTEREKQRNVEFLISCIASIAFVIEYLDRKILKTGIHLQGFGSHLKNILTEPQNQAKLAKVHLYYFQGRSLGHSDPAVNLGGTILFALIAYHISQGKVSSSQPTDNKNEEDSNEDSTSSSSSSSGPGGIPVEQLLNIMSLFK